MSLTKNQLKKKRKMTKKFGILAYPAGHSLSPAMHNAAFEKLGIDASYEFFETPPEKLEEFIQRVRAEHIDGLSVSIPHKEKIIPLLDEITDAAQEIGAVNTVFWREEKLVGDNTDHSGVRMSLMGIFDLGRNKKAVVLGGGGAARAIVYVLLGYNAKVSVITREEWEFKEIKKDFAIKTDLISKLENHDPEILINATPLGMVGKFEGKSFVPKEYFENHKPFVFDVVYNPRETQLLKDAKNAGCKTLNGLHMLIYQAIFQLKLWLPPEKWKIVDNQNFVDMMWGAAVTELEK